MKPSNTRGDRGPAGQVLSPNEASSIGIELHIIELLAKGIPWESPNNPGYCFTKTDGKASLLKAIPTDLTEHEAVKLVPI